MVGCKDLSTTVRCSKLIDSKIRLTQPILDESGIPNSIHPLNFYKNHSQKVILSMAIADEALLHSVLAYSMIHNFCFQSDTEPSQVEKLRYVESNPEILSHKTQAIRLINERLNNGVASEITIATVLVLLFHHVSSCLKQVRAIQ
jgi:Fungal specific transcription factor domain